jgi:hypothetical protein
MLTQPDDLVSAKPVAKSGRQPTIRRHSLAALDPKVDPQTSIETVSAGCHIRLITLAEHQANVINGRKAMEDRHRT